MKRKDAWTKRELRLLREQYGNARVAELAARLNRTPIAVTAMAKKLGIQRKRTRIPWTQHDLEIVRRDYPHIKTEKIAKALGRTPLSVYLRAASLGLKKTKEYLASPDANRLRRDSSVGIPYRFQKGHASYNKGLRRPGWHRGRMRETQFKKGNRPHTWKPIGTERISDEGYVQRKMTDTGYPPRDWRCVHHLLWEQHHGPIPAGHIVCFKDGNRSHIAIENLECISRGELAKRNHWAKRYPKPIKDVIALRIAIKRKITMRERYGTRNRRTERAPVRHHEGAQGPGKADGRRSRQGDV